MTVFVPFPQDTEYFGRPEQQWVINFRVRNLDAMVEQLRGARIEATLDPETYPNGRFAQSIAGPRKQFDSVMATDSEVLKVLEPPEEIAQSEPSRRVITALRDRGP